MDYKLIDILVGLSTALIMFGTGLSLRLSDFKNIFVFPKAIISALFAQMIALPIIAFSIVYFAPISAEFKVGVVILASTPGGATSAFITYLLRGDIALSISLTAVNSFLTLFTIPIIVNIGLQLFGFENTPFNLPILKTVAQILIIIITPTFLGVMVRHIKPHFAIKFEEKIKIIMISLLLIVFFMKFFANENNGGVVFKRQDFSVLLPYAIFFNLCCLFFGYYFIRLLKLNHKNCMTTAIEASVHNTPLALLIAGTLIGNQEMVKPILIYAIFTFWTALIFGAIMNRIAKE